MRSRIPLLAFVLFALALRAQARLGDTREQCEERYGSFVKQDLEKQSATYKQSGWVIEIIYRDNIAVALTYRHEKEPLGISPETVRTILDRNGGIAAWKSTDPHNWVRSDGARAVVSADSQTVRVTGKAVIAEEDATKKSSEKVP